MHAYTLTQFLRPRTLQEALKLKEQKVATEVVVVSVGPKSSQVSIGQQHADL